MASSPIDAVDRGILYHLQKDAQQPLTNIATALNVADNTVRNRIEKLEEQRIIKRYTIDVDYAAANIQHHYIFICTTRVSDRERLVEAARKIPGVVRVMSVMTGNQNVHVEVAAPTKERITSLAYKLDEAGLVIERENFIWSEYRQPYSGFQMENNI